MSGSNNIIRRLLLFNPDCEMAIANGSSYYTPSATIAQMEADLAYLPLYYAEEGDGVLVTEQIDAPFLKSRRELLALKSTVVTFGEIDGIQGYMAEPWGWSPRACHLLREMKGTMPWTVQRKELYSRLTALEILKRLSGVEKDIIPTVCRTFSEVAECTDGRHSVIKAPWSSSGRGLLFVNDIPDNKEKQWVGGVLRRQGYVMVERYLDKSYDFAMEFCIDEEGCVEYLGLSEFYIGTNGEYKGNYVGPQRDLEKRLDTMVENEQMLKVQREIRCALSEMIAPFYKGFLGVDMMVYRDVDGQNRIQPCVEINLRCNMGIVALNLKHHYLSDASKGIFRIDYYPLSGEAYRTVSGLQTEHPVELNGTKIVSGYINLTPVNENTHFVASLEATPYTR